MNVACTACDTVYRVDPAKIPSNGVRARCAECGAVFWVRSEALAAAAVAQTPAPEPSSPSPVVGPPVDAPAPAAPRADYPESRPIVPPAGLAPPTLAPGPAAAPQGPPPVRDRPGPLGPSVPAMPGRVDPAPVAPSPTTGPPPWTPSSPVTSPAAEPIRPAPSPSVAPPRGTPSAAPAAAPPTTPKRRPNPFLSQNPESKARRLARALISDMVVYHPAKRREGLEAGTLKTLFEEEIRKSWEEFVDQVGKPLADSTSFFNDALNEILADGKQLFP